MFENKIDYWMEVKGLKNKYLAKRCNVSEQTFSKWRQNKTQPSIEQAAILARLLGVSLDELVDFKEEN